MKILSLKYTSYENSLLVCGLDSLKSRRNKLCLKFALKCVEGDSTKDIFPLRLAKSAIPFMQKLLNKHEKQKKTKKT